MSPSALIANYSRWARSTDVDDPHATVALAALLSTFALVVVAVGVETVVDDISVHLDPNSKKGSSSLFELTGDEDDSVCAKSHPVNQRFYAHGWDATLVDASTGENLGTCLSAGAVGQQPRDVQIRVTTLSLDPSIESRTLNSPLTARLSLEGGEIRVQVHPTAKEGLAVGHRRTDAAGGPRR